jgi:hypothetical protein
MHDVQQIPVSQGSRTVVGIEEQQQKDGLLCFPRLEGQLATKDHDKDGRCPVWTQSVTTKDETRPETTILMPPHVSSFGIHERFQQPKKLKETNHVQPAEQKAKKRASTSTMDRIG